jgi:pimeloyl-ACP methyl ester carboxylesterase
MEMQQLSRLIHKIAPLVVPAAVVIVGVHVVDASLLHISKPLVVRLLTAVVAMALTAAIVRNHSALPAVWRGSLAFGVGLPAMLFGAGVHATHVYQLGFNDSDYTGILMMLAGLLLSVIGTTMLVRQVHVWWRRLLLVPVGVVVAVFLIAPLAMAVYATNIGRLPANSGESPADRGLAYEDVTFETAQGLTISAWYIPSRNGAAIVTVHGAGKNRATVMDEAAMLARHGYGVLMVDLEGFGDSEGRGNAMGWVGARDIQAAVAYLGTREEVASGAIGGLGLSMGGEVLLQAAAEIPDLAAVVSEGGTNRTLADVKELDGTGKEAIHVFFFVMQSAMHVLSHEPPPPPLKESVAKIGPRPVLLIAANIAMERDFMSLYQEVGGPSFEMWTIAEAKHVGAFDLHPQEYEQRVIAFFDDALLDKGGVATGVR